MTPAERVALNMTITKGDAFSFLEWTHSNCPYIMGEAGQWYSIDREEVYTTAQLYNIWLQQNKPQ